MDRMEIEKTMRRLQGHLAHLGRQFPGIWREVDRARTIFRRSFTWPDWCFLPIAGYLAILTGGDSGITKRPTRNKLAISVAVQRLAAFAPWRTTQGIYWFHPEVLDQVASTPLTGNLPVNLLLRLPEWSIYVPLPADRRFFRKEKTRGFFAHLEYDVNAKRPELRFLVDENEGFIPFILHLRAGTIEEAVKEAQNEGLKNMSRYGYEELKKVMPGPEVIERIIEEARAMVSLILYINSINADIYCPQDPTRKPAFPKAKKIKRGQVRLFPPSRPTSWKVGYRIGVSLQGAKLESPGRTHAAPRPHIRRAHWHSYWVGPRKAPKKRRLVVKWLHPIVVGASHDKILRLPKGTGSV